MVQSRTTQEHVFLVADDGSKDGTATSLRSKGVKVITGVNRGVAWNKNRALFYLFQVASCDVVILLEDDCFPTRDGWQADWMAAATQWGHVNLAGKWFSESFLSGSGTLSDPVRCARLSGQCTAFSREAISFVGYVDTRYRGYGFAHAEHSERMVRGGYGGTMETVGHELAPVFYMLNGDIHVEAAETFRDPQDVSRNAQLRAAIRHESIHRWAWRTDEEMQMLRDEVRAVDQIHPPDNPLAGGEIKRHREVKLKTAACVMSGNDAGTIVEWLAYHFAIGFDTVVIIRGRSNDGTHALIEAVSSLWDVRVFDWPFSYAERRDDAYRVICRELAKEFDWVGFFDADEFVLPVGHDDVKDWLDTLNGAEAVALNWAIYGSSGHSEAPEGLLIENYLKRAPDAFGPNRHVKSIVRPGSVRDVVNPHFFRIDGIYVDAEGVPITWRTPGLTDTTPHLETCRVNHYFTRSRADWAKIVDVPGFDSRSWKDFTAYDRNEVEDETILKFAQRTRLELMRIRHLGQDLVPMRNAKA
jgi:hypothetical protein